MKTMKKVLIIIIFFAISGSLLSDVSSNFWFPKIGKFSGQTEASLGFHFWSDHLYIRNLQIRTYSYIYPGIRINSVIRSNKEVNLIEMYRDSETIYEKIEPNFDELYLELFGFHYSRYGKISGSLRIGKIRYLRFPYYDNIAKFDQVAGLTDIRSGEMSGYYGEILCLDYFSEFGFGCHYSLIHWDLYERTGFDFIESYLFFKKEFGIMEFEARTGYLQTREEPVGKSDFGYSIYLGGLWKGYRAGIYLENISNEIFTGFSISFAPSRVTELLGKVKLDYTRADEGFSMQIPFIKKAFGGLKKDIPENSELVGTITAERVITFWRAGMMRNFYEHIISKNGDTDSNDLIVRINEKPVRLDIESIVSPYHEFKSVQDFIDWNSQGYRLGQYSQNVIYEFYKAANSN